MDRRDFTHTIRTQMFVDGRFCACADKRSFAVFNPATGAEIAQVPDAGNADVDAAVQAARRAFVADSWPVRGDGCRPQRATSMAAPSSTRTPRRNRSASLTEARFSGIVNRNGMVKLAPAR